MKIKTLTLFLLLIPTLVYSQHKLRPILDSTVPCSKSNTVTYHIQNPLYEDQEKTGPQVFYIVEKMPESKSSVSDIENMLGKVIRFNKEEMTYKHALYFQCIVNCKGEAGDYQIIHCPEEFVNVGCQLLNVLRTKLNNWEPGEQRNIQVDVFVKIKVLVNKGKFKVVAPFY